MSLPESLDTTFDVTTCDCPYRKFCAAHGGFHFSSRAVKIKQFAPLPEASYRDFACLLCPFLARIRLPALELPAMAQQVANRMLEDHLRVVSRTPAHRE